MLTTEQARAKFGLNPLDEVTHAIERVVSVCGKDEQFAALARMVRADVIQTLLYTRLCDYLEQLKTTGQVPTLLLVRKQTLTFLALELGKRGLRESLLALSTKSKTKTQ